MTRARLEFRNVTKRFSSRKGDVVTAVTNLDFHINDGEIVSIIGPSGCGKSTLLNMGSGLDPASEGEVFVDGELVVKFGLEVQHRAAKDRRAIALDLLKKCRLQDFVDHYPHQLSGGMRQRAALARTLAVDPAVLLMDEPFSALDAQTKMVLQQDLGRTLAETRKTALFVTHDLVEAIALSDRVLVMSQRPGTIVQEIIVEIPDMGNPMARRKHPKVGTYVSDLMELLHIEEAVA